MSVLEALVRHYDQLHARGEAPPYGFSRERIPFAIVLSDAGEAVTVSALSERSGDAPRRTVCEVPHAVRRTSGPVANFLWDKTGYVFGVKRDPATRRPCPAHREHDAFRELHEGLLAGADDEGLRALLRFLRAWDPNDYGALPHAEAMLGSNVIFRLEGERDWLHERAEAISVWAEHLARTMPAHGTCLVTGTQAPIALVHPVVKGVWGTHAAGGALVTFNLDTFESYGKTQGANAPISTQAAFAYTTALNALLAPQSRRRVRIGDMTVVFWADVTDDVDTASQVEALLWHAIVEGESAIARTLEAIARGEPLTQTTPPVPVATRFHILGLAANVGRLSVRLWHVDTLGALARRIVEHWDGSADRTCAMAHTTARAPASLRDRSPPQGRSHPARARPGVAAGHPQRHAISTHPARRGHRARSRREDRHRRTGRHLPGLSRPRPPIGLRTGGCTGEPRPR